MTFEVSPPVFEDLLKRFDTTIDDGVETRVINRYYQDKPVIQIIPAQGDTDQAERTINAIEKTFSPLKTSLYGSKTVILCDQPSPERRAGVTDFLNRHGPQNENKQFFFLARASIEECYPERNGWRRTHAQQEAMDGRRKRQLAKRVGNDITEEEFEVGMSEVFRALARSWELAF